MTERELRAIVQNAGATLEARMGARARLKGLTKATRDGALLTPVAEWKASHQAQILEHRRQHIAISKEGIVAFGISMVDVYEQLERRGVDIDSVVFDYVK